MEMLTDTHSPRDSWKKAALKAMSRETFFFFFSRNCISKENTWRRVNYYHRTRVSKQQPFAARDMTKQEIMPFRNDISHGP